MGCPANSYEKCYNRILESHAAALLRQCHATQLIFNLTFDSEFVKMKRATAPQQQLRQQQQEQVVKKYKN